MNYKEQNFIDNVENVKEQLSKNVPLLEVARYLKIKYDTLLRYLIKYNITFKTNQHRQGFAHIESQIPVTFYLNGGKYITAARLRKLLLRDGLKEAKCECCGLSEWRNKPIPLELHHKDLNRYNNNLDNLQVLCSNCHAQAHNYSNCNK